MKKLLSVLATLLLLNTLVTAQTNYCAIKYTYDASGNRIKRVYQCGVLDTLLPSGGGGGSARLANPNATSQTSHDFEVYPNPTTGMVTVKLLGTNTNPVLNIVNQTGQTVYSQALNNTEEQINLSAFVEGMYYFVLITDESKSVKKVIKKE